MADIVWLQDKSARLDALRQALIRSAAHPEIYAASDVNNPRLVSADHFFCGKTDDPDFINQCIAKITPRPTLISIIGPEEPLETAVADLFWKLGILHVWDRSSNLRD